MLRVTAMAYSLSGFVHCVEAVILPSVVRAGTPPREIAEIDDERRGAAVDGRPKRSPASARGPGRSLSGGCHFLAPVTGGGALRSPLPPWSVVNVTSGASTDNRPSTSPPVDAASELLGDLGGLRIVGGSNRLRRACTCPRAR